MKKTQGRLRYVFGLLQRLFHTLHVGDLTDKITLDIARPMLIKLAKDRVIRNGVSASEEALLKIIAKTQRINSTNLASKMKKTRQHASNLLARMIKLKLVEVRSEGRNLYYSPTLDVATAYGEEM